MDLVAASRRRDVGDPVPQGRIPGRGVEDPMRHGPGGRGVLLDLHLRGVLLIRVLLRLDLGDFDLLSGLGDGGAQVSGLGGCGHAGYLAGVLGRSERVPMLGLAELPGLQLGAPVVPGDVREREEALRGCGRDAAISGLVVEQARIRQHGREVE